MIIILRFSCLHRRIRSVIVLPLAPGTIDGISLHWRDHPFDKYSCPVKISSYNRRKGRLSSIFLYRAWAVFHGTRRGDESRLVARRKLAVGIGKIGRAAIIMIAIMRTIEVSAHDEA